MCEPGHMVSAKVFLLRTAAVRVAREKRVMADIETFVSLSRTLGNH